MPQAMNKCINAVNVSFGDQSLMGRPSDVWRLDPRIPHADRMSELYYVRNKFVRVA
jgi:hypothetical protein